MGALFRGKILAALERAHARGDIDVARVDLSPLRKTSWIVYAKRPFGVPEQVIRYLGRYTNFPIAPPDPAPPPRTGFIQRSITEPRGARRHGAAHLARFRNRLLIIGSGYGTDGCGASRAWPLMRSRTTLASTLPEHRRR